MRSTDKVIAIVDQHFKLETPELIERVIETFSDHVIWEAPARNLYLTDHAMIVAQYRKILAGIANPKMELVRQFAKGGEVFDDRILYFTALPGNVWGVSANQQVKMRLVHYFNIRDEKIVHEIGYEMWTLC